MSHELQLLLSLPRKSVGRILQGRHASPCQLDNWHAENQTHTGLNLVNPRGGAPSRHHAYAPKWTPNSETAPTTSHSGSPPRATGSLEGAVYAERLAEATWLITLKEIPQELRH